MSNAKRRYRRRRRCRLERERQVARWEAQGLWDFSRSGWYQAEGGGYVHITRGGFGYY